jgi:hypothetical protein
MPPSGPPGGLGLPGTEGRRLDPVLAGGGAEPAGAVARGVHVDAVTAGGRADPDPAAQVAAEHHGSPSGWLATHVEALRAAGFSEVGTLWQRGNNRIPCGVRGT